MSPLIRHPKTLSCQITTKNLQPTNFHRGKMPQDARCPSALLMRSSTLASLPRSLVDFINAFSAAALLNPRVIRALNASSLTLLPYGDGSLLQKQRVQSFPNSKFFQIPTFLHKTPPQLELNRHLNAHAQPSYPRQ